MKIESSSPSRSPGSNEFIAAMQKWFQLVLLYAGGPAAAYFLVRAASWMVIPLILTAGIGSWIALSRDPSATAPVVRGDHNPRMELLRIAVIWALAAAILGAATYQLLPELWLGFPRRAPLFWAAVMVLYPLLSALPQEVFFRMWFFERYEALFHRPFAAVLANAILFSAAHVIMENWIAVVATLPLGLLLAWTYVRTRSLLLVWIEHTLYGGLVFTLGLGLFFIPRN